ncbi:unnamed protein product, partial [Mesorhabditis belari]|uniref:sarcosine oxidasee (formaldehyde-forming) n=1 Tax=Mesorhabditis belari TaxID=2138241 RepID=A0AAF3ETL1_9BILA
MPDTYDVVVVGAGIFGSCTAYHCQKRGLKTLLIEQFSLGHKNGSSHGKSRIIRYAHPEGFYIPVVKDSYEQIEELEKKRGEKLWKNCGLLYLTNANHALEMSSHLNKHNCKNEIIVGNEINKRYPQYEYDDSWSAVFDPKGGVLYADKWLNAFQDEFKKIGGIVYEKEKVISYRDGEKGIILTTMKRVIKAKKAIFTVGTWLQQLVPELVPIVKAQPEAICVVYWKPKRESDLHYFGEDKMPVAIMENKEKNEYVYGLPTVDYPNAIKFGFHGGDRYNIGDEAHPPDQELIEKPRRHLQKHLKMIDASAPVHIDRCKYTMSLDDHYVIDQLPESPNVYVAGCCSGTGFKVAPAIGRGLACWVKNEKAPFDLSHFSLQRFKKSKI